MNAKKQCFVLMGFGEKVDYKTNRTLDLDKTYRLIRDAVEQAGLECIRADDIVHAGVIDKPMYENLLSADIAIADLSTSNENAIYELGVRHTLRPHTTIVLAEKQFKFPFDLNHLVIRSYEHLGTGIDYKEAERLKREIVTAISTIGQTGRRQPGVHLPAGPATAVDRSGGAGVVDFPGWPRGGLRSAGRGGAGGQREVLTAARPVPRGQEGERLGSGARVSREAARDHPRRSVSDPAACTGDLQEQAAERA